MVLIHSKQKTPDEIESFVNAWDGRIPLVIVPTSYPQMNAERILALGKIQMVIYGNHAIRACVKGMQDVFAKIRSTGGIAAAEPDIVPVTEIFRLQDMDRMKEHEARFLREPGTRAILAGPVG